MLFYELLYENTGEYIFSKNPTDLTILSEYADMLTDADAMTKKFEAWDEDELSTEELKYYLDVNNRVMQKLVDVSGQIK